MIDIYQSARWKRERLAFLIDHPLCVDCKAEGYVVAATDVDHETPHRGNMVLFWDQSMWRPRCHSHHSTKTMRESNERRA
jgi:5-methylcytosine-specific restriction protein A